jgi:preprotein translocase subunit SecE
MLDNVKEAPGNWLSRSRKFLSEVRNEMGRVTWPSRKEVYATTFVVILTSIFFGLYLWGVDLLFNGFIGWIFQRFGAA